MQISTDSCLSYLQDKVAKGFDSDWFTGMIFVDLQQVFNAIDYKILTKKWHVWTFLMVLQNGLNVIFQERKQIF